jgi:hypothetical protein
MTKTHENQSVSASVRKELLVEAGKAKAFHVFTTEFGRWWPLATHHIGSKSAETATIEPFVNGRWYERAMDGTECEWGRVLVWDPPNQIVLSWNISSSWRFDGSLLTEVDVRFEMVTAERTRVVLEHRHLDRYGSDAEKMRTIFDDEGGWTGILRHYQAHAVGGPVASVGCPSKSDQSA